MPDEPPPSPLDVNVVPTIGDDPQRVAMVKSVNDTLNAYISITDAKAGAFLGGAAAAASFFLSQEPKGTGLVICYVISAIGYVSAAVAAANVIFPRVPGKGSGVVFWGDIASRKSAQEYHDEFEKKCAGGGFVADYAWLNWCTSTIIKRKVRRLRIAMALCFLSLAVSVPAYIYMKHAATP
ncbi:MAG TPA: Pycsar system effector family protein [Verrucomicrobiales bacterium]|jgi:hypothetical protein|nr:Pycsar system effector family protein [Verrucomicrobiales bacterium]